MKGHIPDPDTDGPLTGADLRAMIASASRLLEHNVEAINALNVFPVPDGDTGTNMYLTLREVVGGVADLESASASEVASAMARCALMGARGNSGVILSQLFKGIALGLEGTSEFGAEELVRAFNEARDRAYQAVGEPVEGTMLTVMRIAADAAQATLDGGGTVSDVVAAACAAAREAVAMTPTMLPVLRDAGVVDAGGQGLSVMLEGMRRSLAGEDSAGELISPPEPVGVEGAMGAVAADFLASTDEKLYGYCTQFLVEGEGLDPDWFRERMSTLAGSTVVVGDETMVNVHVHTDDPGPVLSLGVSHGTLGQVKVQNMDEQHTEFSAARRLEAEAPALSVAVVAVAWGKGLEALFTSLGASVIVAGGNTMNSSVQDLCDAMERAPAENVVLMPNNRNILPAAMQAAQSSPKTARVIPSRTIPEGIAAILSFNGDRDLEANVADMEGALGGVRTGEVTEAVRSATLNGVGVQPGQLIGLLNGELVAAGGGLSKVVESVLRKADVSKGDLVTLYSGDRLTADDAAEVARDVNEVFPEIELEVVEGGQPHYHFILSIE